MKISEFRKLIREEIKKIYSEGTKVYVDPGKAPKGVRIQKGPKGGLFYDTGTISKSKKQEQTPISKRTNDFYHFLTKENN